MLSKRNINEKTLNEIRALDESVKRIKIKSIDIFRSDKSVRFNLICDNAVTEEVQKKIYGYIRGKLPVGFNGLELNVVKIVADKDIVERTLRDYISKEFMSVAHSVLPENVRVIDISEICVYELDLDEDILNYFSSNSLIDRIDDYLNGEFCNDFKGNLVNIGKTAVNSEILKVKLKESDYETVSCRSFTVSDTVKLWGNDIDPEAIYIADSEESMGNVSFAGTVTQINQKETRTGKPFYIIELNDKTGRISGKIFMTKDKEKKIQKIQVGSEIITKGELSVYNGFLSYKINDVSFCKLPENFIPKERESKKVPDDYSLIFPESLEEIKQENFLAAPRQIPDCFNGKTFVVVDIETTGISFADGDKITEIGAVKIVDGKITSKFQSLINPEKKISPEITTLTGIDDEMVKSAPKWVEVIPDFFRFSYNSVIVAHNIEFDYKFIKFMSKESGYKFSNKGIDTLELSRELLPKLNNHKLNTVCENFGIEFQHHRALSDAHATAQLFIDLILMKKCLPDI